MSETAEQLMSRLLQSSEPDGSAANDLLREFFRGYPTANLHRLLTSSNEVAVASGAFIAAELGASAAVVQDDLVQLARYPLPSVRCDVIGAIGGMRELATLESIAIAMGGIIDDDELVRWKAIRFLGFIDGSLLGRSAAYVTNAELRSAISPLISPHGEGSIAGIFDQPNEPRRLERLVALVAAIRVRDRSIEPLQLAASSSDEEIRTIANEYLDENSNATMRRSSQ